MATQRSARDVLQDLAELHDLTHPDGRPNFSAISRRTGIPVPTVSRIYRGGNEWRMNSETIAALVDAFNISFAQARGDAPIKRRGRGKLVPTESELELLRTLRSLPVSEQRRVRAFLEALADTAAAEP